uniref:Kit ligand n=1 Tax=Denticeps clupeoides TaxID=299321 RepID=A0AAY4D6I7_9TELE
MLTETLTFSFCDCLFSNVCFQIGESPCVLLLLFSSLVASDGEGRTPVTDDVATLNLLKENIPKDYRIPIHYIPKELAGQCWLQLNIYPVERSLSQLASKFGNLSTNRENITIFITMLQGLRLMIDDEERVTWATGPYFDYIKEFFGAAAKTPGKLSCVPPPCPRPSQSPTGLRHAQRCKHALLPLLHNTEADEHCPVRWRQLGPYTGESEEKTSGHHFHCCFCHPLIQSVDGKSLSNRFSEP